MSYPPTSPDNQLQTPPHTNSAGEDNPDHATPPRRAWGTWLIISTLFLVVFGPLAYKWFPREIALWHVAAAEEKYEADDVEGAIASLDKALEWDPNNLRVFYVRGTWKLMNAEFAESIDDFKVALKLEPNNALLLNVLAYSQALAKSDLEEALGHVNRALEFSGDNAAMLDTRGYIQLLLGNLSEARADLDSSVEQAEQELSKAESLSVNPRALKERKHNVGVIRYHRALLFDELELADDAEQDYQRVRELGFEPDENLF